MFATTQMGGLDFGYPDVCMTPAGHTSVPVPYPVVATPSMGFPTADNVLFGNAPAHNLSTKIPVTNGSEAGVNMGAQSGTYMGPSRYMTGSSTVLADGIPAARLTSVTLMNSTNCHGATIIPSQLKVVLLAR